jgi:hypothetical protein
VFACILFRFRLANEIASCEIGFKPYFCVCYERHRHDPYIYAHGVLRCNLRFSRVEKHRKSESSFHCVESLGNAQLSLDIRAKVGEELSVFLNNHPEEKQYADDQFC